jgi:tripartite-type tricarboxylate transporter receptor subunit TctC
MPGSVEVNHVPYRNNFMPDLLSGQVQVAFTTITLSIEYMRTGKLRALAVTSAMRSATREVSDLRQKRLPPKSNRCHA